MFALAWIFLPDLPEYRTGLIIVGLARCIAMVLIWNDLAGGDREAAAVLVAVNSLFQIVAYSLLGYFYLEVLPGWLGLRAPPPCTCRCGRSPAWWLVFLGIPLAAGYLTRRIGDARKGARLVRRHRFLPRIGPIALYGLLFTVVVLFALQGDKITHNPLDVARIAAAPARLLRAHVERRVRARRCASGSATRAPPRLAFTAAGNNFELAIAVAIGVFGVTSGQALAGVVGPLIEVPALVALVYVALWARRRYFPPEEASHELLRLRPQRHLARAAVAVCHDCGAAVCVDHAVPAQHWLTRTSPSSASSASNRPPGSCAAAPATPPTPPAAIDPPAASPLRCRHHLRRRIW